MTEIRLPIRTRHHRFHPVESQDEIFERKVELANHIQELVSELIGGDLDRRDRRITRRIIRNDLAALEELEPTASWWRRRRPARYDRDD